MTSISDRTVLGALTTDFEAPASCSALQFTESPYGTMEVYPGVSCTATDDSYSTVLYDGGCYPSGYKDYVEIWSASTMAMYSPATGCPAGYSEALSVSHAPGETYPTYAETTYHPAYSSIWYHLFEGEEAVACCTSGYTIHEDYYYYCTSNTKAPSASVTGFYYTNGCEAVETVVELNADVSTAIATNLGIMLLRQGSGESRTPDTTVTGTDGILTPIATGASGPNGDSSDFSTTGGSGTNGGMPMRTIIAIAVVGGVALLALIMGVVFWLRRRKRRNAGIVPPQSIGPQGAATGAAGAAGAAGVLAKPPGSAPYGGPQYGGPHGPHGAPQMAPPPMQQHGYAELMGTAGGAHHHKTELDSSTTYLPKPSPASTPVHELGYTPAPSTAGTFVSHSGNQNTYMPPPQELGDTRAASVSPIHGPNGQTQNYFPPPPPPQQYNSNFNQPWRHG